MTYTSDLARIRRIPQRKLGENTEEFEKRLNALVSLDSDFDLRPVQLLSLLEMGEHRGFVGSIRVGGGKTLISLIGPVVCQLQRPILLVPASLREKTEHDRRMFLTKFRVARNLRVISYEELGREKAADLLELYKPDGIFADEAHRLKNRRAGVRKRVARYMQKNPQTFFAAMSGTLLKNSIADIGEIIKWALKDNSPLPSSDATLQLLSDALENNLFRDAGIPAEADELVDFYASFSRNSEFTSRTEKALDGLRERLVATPGFVSTGDEGIACGIQINPVYLPENVEVSRTFEVLRDKWETPDGWALSSAVDVWRHARELSLGLHYVWEPRPPEGWLSARKEWAGFVREILSRSRTLDTPKQVKTACQEGKLDSTALDAWEAVKDTYRGISKPVWHASTALDVCAKWAKKPGIVWVAHTFFGQELAKRTGLPFFGAEGTDDQGRALQVFGNMQGKIASTSIICSIQACGTGFNLQPWSRNLVTCCPTSSADWEQLIGRTHRDGQLAEDVEIDVLFGCQEHFAAWDRAQARARLTHTAMGQTQKILLATSTIPMLGRPTSGPRWETTSQAKGEDLMDLLQKALDEEEECGS